MRVLITGASSGIGKGLACHYAKEHDVIACGRNKMRLEALNRETGVETLEFDITCKHEVIDNFAHLPMLDLVILNAGDCEYMPSAENFDSELFARVIEINLVATGYCLEALLPRIKAGGQLVVISSSVTLLPLPKAQAYGASKAGLSYLARVLGCSQKNIDVTLVEPGFVQTPLTDKNEFAMPFRISVEKAVLSIVKGVEKRRTLVRFPRRFIALLHLLRLLPVQLWRRVVVGVVR